VNGIAPATTSVMPGLVPAAPSDARADAAPVAPDALAAFAGLLAQVLRPKGLVAPAPTADTAMLAENALTGESEGTTNADGTTSTTPAARPMVPVDTALPLNSFAGTPARDTAPAAAPGGSPTDVLRSFVERVARGTSDTDADVDTDAASAHHATEAAAPASAPAPAPEPTPAPTPAPDGAAIIARAALDPSLVVRDLQTLDPALRAKIERITERMRDEYGQTVTVNETWRSQSRQDRLFEQGRSRAGSVVTWTQRSQHTTGLAADLVVDGTYNDPVGYARLQRVAAEEGLRTLGSRDPGHVELPRTLADRVSVLSAKGMPPAGSLQNATVAGTPPVALPMRDERRMPPASAAGVAQVATVAQVASVAQVAAVAQATPATPAAEAAAPAAAASTSAVQRPGRELGSADKREKRDNAPRDRDVRVASIVDSTAPTPSARVTPSPRLEAPGAIAGLTHDAARPVVGSDAAARVERIAELQANDDMRPVSHVTLKMDNASGGEDRIRVDLRGSNVGATLDIGDAGVAQQLSARLPDLGRALEARGLEAGAMEVRTRTTGPDAAPNSGDRSSHDREKDPSGQQFSRQRSRREQQGRPQ
jgi:hypothetical protein